MELKVGDKVVYPNHGVGLIEQISLGNSGARPERFYLLRILSSGLKVMVPASNADTVGLRRVIRGSETQKILAYLANGKCNSHHDWKWRYKENSEKMRTGSLFQVAEVLKSLAALSKTKALSFREKKMLDRARFLIVSELATARGVSEVTVEQNVITALARARLRLP